MLVGLALVPIAVYFWARRHFRQFRATATGIGFGVVAAPFSLGLYAAYFLGPWGIATGVIGLIAVMFHGAPGYYILVSLGVIPSHTVVTGISHLYVEATNALVWGVRLWRVEVAH